MTTHTEIRNLTHVDQSTMDDWQPVSLRQVAFVEQAIFEAWYVEFSLHQTPFPEPHPIH